MSQAELLAIVLEVFERLQIDSMLVGSYASSFYGEPRSTHDIDLVIDLSPGKIVPLVDSFDPNRYYLSQQALHEGRMANLIDTKSGDKVDLFLLSDHPDARRQFQRRRTANVLGIDISIASAEDTIVSKLQWSREVGGSERQIGDVREIIRRQMGRLDLDYLNEQLSAPDFTTFTKLLQMLEREP